MLLHSTVLAVLVLLPIASSSPTQHRFSSPHAVEKPTPSSNNSDGGSARGDWRLEPGYNPSSLGHAAPQFRMPGGFSRNIPERKIHSHNDYWRDVPVYEALSHGVRSIEADVWLNPKDQKLYVSHNVAALTAARTFDALYVQPLLRVIEHANPHDEQADFFNETDYYSPENEREVRRPWTGFYDDGGLTPIQLLVDIKTRGVETVEALVRELEPFSAKGWLAGWNETMGYIPGPIKVVLTGNGINPEMRALLAPQPSRNLFMDAPLLRLDETWIGSDNRTYGWTPELAPMASTSYSSATNWTGRNEITPEEKRALGDLVVATQKRGFETRLWSPPRWPTYARDRVWRTLWELGIDWLDADDLDAAAAF
ncbi:hypothetical protein JCM10908_006932 [Rhodotorula pacifica]|uniref:uncharacterized protein n=1 Tax=Rhodotorula pacifica TaxID=1495444 RepID=UPI00317D4A7B